MTCMLSTPRGVAEENLQVEFAHCRKWPFRKLHYRTPLRWKFSHSSEMIHFPKEGGLFDLLCKWIIIINYPYPWMFGLSPCASQPLTVQQKTDSRLEDGFNGLCRLQHRDR